MNSMEEVANIVVPKALALLPCRAVIAVAIMHDGCLEVRSWDLNPDKNFSDEVHDTKEHTENLRRLAARYAVEQLSLIRDGFLTNPFSYKLDDDTVVTLVTSPWHIGLQQQVITKMKE